VALFVAVFSGGCTNSDTHASSSQNASIDAQITACNVATCDLKLPAGNFTFSTQLNPVSIIHISGAGASDDNPGIPLTPQFPFIEAHCITTLTWTGGNRAPFFFNTYHASGSIISGFCLNATGDSPPVFIDESNSAGEILLNDIVIDTPTTKAQVAAIRFGNEGVVVAPRCTDVFVRAAAPVGFDVLNVQAHFMGLRCRAVHNDVNEWVIGDSAHLTESFHCVFCSGEASPGNTPIIIRSVWGFSWVDGYTEGSVAFDIPPDAATAQQISISNSWGSGSDTSGVAAFVHSSLPTATITVSGNEILGGTMSYIVQDDSLSRATVVGNTMPSATVAKNGNNVCAFGNSATPAPTKPATGVCN
jgi:hypothetical protein